MWLFYRAKGLALPPHPTHRCAAPHRPTLLTLVAVHGGGHLPAAHVPHAHRAVLAGTHQCRATRGHTQVCDGPRVALEALQVTGGGTDATCRDSTRGTSMGNIMPSCNGRPKLASPNTSQTRASPSANPRPQASTDRTHRRTRQGRPWRPLPHGGPLGTPRRLHRPQTAASPGGPQRTQWQGRATARSIAQAHTDKHTRGKVVTQAKLRGYL